MAETRVWFITGAGRGMGVDFARTALAAGNAVVATGRDASAVADAIRDADDLLAVSLDVTRRDDAEAAALAAVDRFGRIDVLVNNAGVSHKGYFEEMTPEQVDRQLAVNLVGPMHVTRAVLPVMRAQRSGHIISISSGAGLIGFEFSSVYAAAKAGLEGWMSALHAEVEPFGIATTVVNPGFFRTELISEKSMVYADASIEDYDERRRAQEAWWEGQAGRQPGDPAKLAQALLRITDEQPPPRRFIAGADVIALAERKADELRAQSDAYRDLSTSMSYDDIASRPTDPSGP